MVLPDEAIDGFTAWLEKTYGSLDALSEAWNFHHSMVPAAGGKTDQLGRSEAVPAQLAGARAQQAVGSGS